MPPLPNKRVPKPKLPKGASPPLTPTASNAPLPLFASNHNRNFATKENVQDMSSPSRKTSVKGKLKWVLRESVKGTQKGWLVRLMMLTKLVLFCSSEAMLVARLCAYQQKGKYLNCNAKFASVSIITNARKMLTLNLKRDRPSLVR